VRPKASHRDEGEIMSQLRTCACMLGVLLLTGCAAAGAAEHPTGHTPGGPARTTGHVTGRLLIEGGPVSPYGQQPGERPIPGTVTFTATGHRPVSVGAGAAGMFSAWLPPGQYQVTGRSPDIITVTNSGQDEVRTCSQPVSVTVSARQATTIAVVCIVP
jgi:hypothetical protein